MRRLSTPPAPVRTTPPRTASSHRPARRSSCLPTRPAAGPPPADFAVDVRTQDGRPCLVVSGDLDVATAPLLSAMLEHARHRLDRPDAPVLVDLSRVAFADSCGLSPVLDSCTTVVAASPRVARVLRILAA